MICYHVTSVYPPKLRHYGIVSSSTYLILSYQESLHVKVSKYHAKKPDTDMMIRYYHDKILQ